MKFGLSEAAAAAFLLFAGMAAPAAAQRHALGGEPSRPEDVRILHRFSQCVVRHQPDRARAVLAADYRTRAFDREIRRLAQANWGCAPDGTLRFGLLLFAGGMAESLLLARLGTGDLAPLVSFDPAAPPIEARGETELMSLCTVRAAPAEVAALLTTEPAGEQEAAALRGIMPRLNQCLAAGASVRANRIALRALLALAAYRLSEHRGAAG
ncbi:MAG TPA: hypothetical protein VK614_07980 [Allosphingosinicella sp.]|nr:hypothetical protein [Allosphingosinicella sp.]